MGHPRVSLCWEVPEGSPRALEVLQGHEGADKEGESLHTFTGY